MFRYRLGWTIALCCILGLFLSSCNIGNFIGGAKNPAKHEHIYDNFSGPKDGYWPPTPKNVNNFSGIPNFSGLRIQNSVQEVQVSAILSKDTALQQALGERYTSFAIDILEDGSDTADLAQSSYFNYASNQTIDVRVSNNGEVKLEKFAASEQQPPENTAEVSKAIKLAKADFLNKGIDQVNELKGTAMLAFPKQAYVEETGNSFFATRKLYVTFGVGSGLEPSYSALVDLSDNTVEFSGNIGRY